MPRFTLTRGCPYASRFRRTAMLAVSRKQATSPGRAAEAIYKAVQLGAVEDGRRIGSPTRIGTIFWCAPNAWFLEARLGSRGRSGLLCFHTRPSAHSNTACCKSSRAFNSSNRPVRALPASVLISASAIGSIPSRFSRLVTEAKERDIGCICGAAAPGNCSSAAGREASLSPSEELASSALGSLA